MTIELKRPSVTQTPVLITDQINTGNPQGAIDQSLSKDANGNPYSTAFEVRSTDGGILPPRLTTTQMNALNAANGTFLYNQTVGEMYVKKPSGWSGFSAAVDVPGIYIPAGWGSLYKAALANTSTSRCNIAFAGDSVTQGKGTTDFIAQGYVGLLKSSLQALYGNGGSGYKSSNLGSPYVTNTGTWTNFVLTGNGPGCSHKQTNVNGNTLGFPGITGTSIDVVYLVGTGGGTFNIQIDGGTATPINSVAGGTNVMTQTFTGLSNTAHTVLITCTAGGNTSICGVRGYNDTGVTLDNYAVSDQQSNVYNSVSSSIGVDWTGGQSFTSAKANLIVYASGAYDTISGTLTLTADEYIRNVLTFVKRIKDNATIAGNVDFLFVLPHIGKNQATPNLTSIPDYYAMSLRLTSLARTLGAGIINFSTIYRNSWDYAQGLGFWSGGTDNILPSIAGHQAMANVILPYLLN